MDYSVIVHEHFPEEIVNGVLPDPKRISLLIQKLKTENGTVRDAVARRQTDMIFRLTTKLRELNQVEDDLKIAQRQLSSRSAVWHANYNDPLLNSAHQLAADDLLAAQARIKELHEELASVHFTPDSFIGRQLVSRCRRLQRENETLGQMLGAGSVSAPHVSAVSTTVSHSGAHAGAHSSAINTSSNSQHALQQLVADLTAALQDSERYLLSLDDELRAFQSLCLRLKHTVTEQQRTIADLRSHLPSLPPLPSPSPSSSPSPFAPSQPQLQSHQPQSQSQSQIVSSQSQAHAVSPSQSQPDSQQPQSRSESVSPSPLQSVLPPQSSQSQSQSVTESQMQHDALTQAQTQTQSPSEHVPPASKLPSPRARSDRNRLCAGGFTSQPSRLQSSQSRSRSRSRSPHRSVDDRISLARTAAAAAEESSNVEADAKVAAAEPEADAKAEGASGFDVEAVKRDGDGDGDEDEDDRGSELDAADAETADAETADAETADAETADAETVDAETAEEVALDEYDIEMGDDMAVLGSEAGDAGDGDVDVSDVGDAGDRDVDVSDVGDDDGYARRVSDEVGDRDAEDDDEEGNEEGNEEAHDEGDVESQHDVNGSDADEAFGKIDESGPLEGDMMETQEAFDQPPEESDDESETAEMPPFREREEVIQNTDVDLTSR